MDNYSFRFTLETIQIHDDVALVWKVTKFRPDFEGSTNITSADLDSVNRYFSTDHITSIGGKSNVDNLGSIGYQVTSRISFIQPPDAM